MVLVSVSREEGSWGGDIARDLAKRLGYRLLDRKALLEEAEAFGGINPTAPELDEKRPGFWERLDKERRRYSVLLRRVVYEIALQDNVVFLGRGTGMLLNEVEHALRVLVICPIPVRIARVMERGAGGVPGPLSREQAEEIVRRADRNRAGYVRYLFQTDWLDPQHHSIVLNTDVIDVSAATDLLAEMIASGAYDPTPTSRQRLERLAQASQEESSRVVGGRR
jgi:cytidylate kinase